MAYRRISFAICYLILKTKIRFKEHMKRGAHLLAPGPSGVNYGFVRELMVFLDGIKLGDKAQERERVHPCNVCDKAFKPWPTPDQHKMWKQSGHVFVCKACGKKFKTKNIINRHKKFVCGKPYHIKSFSKFSIWGNDHH